MAVRSSAVLQKSEHSLLAGRHRWCRRQAAARLRQYLRDVGESVDKTIQAGEEARFVGRRDVVEEVSVGAAKSDGDDVDAAGPAGLCTRDRQRLVRPHAVSKYHSEPWAVAFAHQAQQLVKRMRTVADAGLAL